MRHKRQARHSIGIEIDQSLAVNFSCGIQGLEVINGCAIEFLESFPFTGHEFIYLDPPYLLEARRRRSPIYKHEMMDVQSHARLLQVIKSISSPVMISGYWSELYAVQLAAWRTVTFPMMTRGGSSAIEWLWMNYPEPIRLHDYSFIGENKSQRQAFKRLIARQKTRLERMPVLKRRALLAAIRELDQDTASTVSTQ